MFIIQIKKKKVLNFNNVTFDEWTNTYVSDILQKIEPIKENRWKDSQRHNVIIFVKMFTIYILSIYIHTIIDLSSEFNEGMYLWFGEIGKT